MAGLSDWQNLITHKRTLNHALLGLAFRITGSKELVMNYKLTGTKELAMNLHRHIFILQ